MRWRGNARVGAVLAGTIALLAAGCGSSGPVVPKGAAPETSQTKDAWPAPNGDLANTRVASSSIDSGNVHQLGIAWAKPIALQGSFGVMSSTPIVSDGVVYTQDMASNVAAYDFETGKLLWKHDFDAPDEGPNGVTVGYGNVYGATSDFAFALDAHTGKEVWRSEKLTRNANEGIDMAPAVFDGSVYVSTVPGNAKAFYAGNGQGVVWALNADTGETQWSFATVPHDLWSTAHTKINSGGGLWHPPAFDGAGHMFIDIANPAPWPGTDAFPWGTSRPGPNLYTDSVVRLNRHTGKLIWYRQMIPHDVYDWDLQLPPVVSSVGGREVLLSAGKMGYVYETNAKTGKLIWKRAVGVHNGHDADNYKALSQDLNGLPKLPVTVEPGALGGVETQLAVKDGVVYAPIVDLPGTFQTQSKLKLDVTKGKGELVALDESSGSILWTHRFTTPAYGAATVSNDLVFTTTFDGSIWALDRTNGSVVWHAKLPAGTNAPLAIAGDTLVTAASFPTGAGQQAQVIAYRLGSHGKPAKALPPSSTTTVGTGEGGGQGGGGKKPGGPGKKPTTTTTPSSGGASAAGKAVFQANCATCHTLADANAHGSVGPNLDDLKPSLATVKHQVINGGGGMPAFGGRLSDAQIDQVSQYVSSVAGKSSSSSGGGAGGP
ncbi:MAG TPA: PQQ-binding-like beta-propeller repeat protein [Gaiellaceae bacterium]|nr:PQQ-binding-like beta-propeller repeat protein [Gaiellaceae bacterium]